MFYTCRGGVAAHTRHASVHVKHMDPYNREQNELVHSLRSRVSVWWWQEHCVSTAERGWKCRMRCLVLLVSNNTKHLILHDGLEKKKRKKSKKNIKQYDKMLRKKKWFRLVLPAVFLSVLQIYICILGPWRCWLTLLKNQDAFRNYYLT